MLSIKEAIINEIIIKKSKFITFLFRVNKEEEIKTILNDLNNKHKDATHICYAYIIDNIKRFNDDGEPNKTAGFPILNALESQNLNHILCCVVRYFGGIKLGANGLIRAYNNSCISAINKSIIINLVHGKEIELIFLYDKTKTIDNILKDVIIIKKDYGENVCYRVKIELNDYNHKYNDLMKICFSIKEIGNCYIEKD